jgi:hypothetical protein
VTRYRFPQDRATFVYGQDYDPILTPPRSAVVVYEDEALTTLADITDLGGTPIALSTLYTAQGLIPEFLGPDDLSRLWTGSQGSAYPLDAQVASLLAGSGIGGSVAELRRNGVAAVALSGHRVVMPQVNGQLNYASNDNVAHLAAPLWITTGAASPGSPVDVLITGLMVEPSWSWTPGPVYLGANGQLTQTPPAAPGALFLAQVGTATSPTTLFVDRAPSIKIT